ncbi:MAG TPA: glycoside hydrolase family 3 C-terminal domain-containing protein, partial [Bacteroidales bacterium]|nr:glycoside hydrolase family 3 C-terminal domain-containing protein [Bacteroidales bacterium]
AAEKLVNNDTFKEKASLALRKSIVLLRNENETLPLKPKTKVYFESLQGTSRGPASGEPNIFPANNNKYDLEFVKTPGEADVLILWLQPAGNALFGSTGAPISLSLSKCGVDVEYVNKLTAKKTAILVINYTNPWVINEVYNESAKNIPSVLATFGTTPDALLDVITGRFNPTGKMPFATPLSDEAVEKQKEDVPGFMEEEGYALFKYDEGLSYPVR